MGDQGWRIFFVDFIVVSSFGIPYSLFFGNTKKKGHMNGSVNMSEDIPPRPSFNNNKCKNLMGQKCGFHYKLYL